MLRNSCHLEVERYRISVSLKDACMNTVRACLTQERHPTYLYNTSIQRMLDTSCVWALRSTSASTHVL